MEDSLGHAQPDANLSHPLGNAQVPVGVALCGAEEVHATPSKRDVPVARTRPHALHPAPPHNSPIHGLPTEILLIVFQLVTHSRTRGDLYTLLGLTHVCRIWRSSLVHYPRAWSTIFATRRDRRSFVEMCLERSRPLPLEVTVDTGDKQRVPVGCTCAEDKSRRLFLNEETPCEWHFAFELLAHPDNSKRIQVLNANSSSSTFLPVLELGSCRVFDSPLPQLTTLKWKDEGTKYAHRLFSAPHPLPDLQSMIFEGPWNRSLSRVNNLTSFTIKSPARPLDAEAIRLFVSNNRSLESLELYLKIRGSTKGSPVDLLNLKSLSVISRAKALSTVIRVPAFERLSTLRISLENESGDWHTLCSTGDGISLSTKSWALDVMENWQDLTGYARPIIQHVCLYDQKREGIHPHGDFCTMITGMMVDAHTVDIGLTYSGCWSGKFWAELRQLGPQLKTIRFEVSEKMEPFGGASGPNSVYVDRVLDNIADLVEYRFREGRPVSTVERMVVSEDEQVNRLQDNVWRWLYNNRSLQKYLAPV